MARWVSLIVLIGIIVVTGTVLYRVMATFLLPLFLASVLTVIFRPLHERISEQFPNRPGWASLMTTIVILLAVLIPVGMISTLAVREAIRAISGDVLDRAEVRISRLRGKLGLELPFQRILGEESDPLGLADLDEMVSRLPDRLPDHSEVTSQEEQQVYELLTGIGRLQENIRLVREFVDADSRPAVATLEVRRIRKMADDRGDDAFAPLEEMHRILLTSLDYFENGEDVLRPELTYDEIIEEERLAAEEEERRQAELEAREAEGETDDAEASNGGPESAVDVAQRDPLKTPEEPAEEDASPEDERLSLDQLRRGFARLKANYFAFRIDLLGGAIWAWLTDLVNPTDVELDSVRVAIQRYLRGWLPSVAGQATAIVGGMLLGLAIMSLSVFYFLKDGPAMIGTLMRLSPLDSRYEQELLFEFDRVSRAVVLATLLSALAQGLLASLAYLLAGFESVFLLTGLTIVFAMVPFVGAAAVWFPACLWLAFVEERLVAAVVLFFYGTLFISMADNVIKPYVLHGQSKLHPLLALLSVLGGVQALGPIGILVGPMVVSFLQALLNILNDELESFDSRSQLRSR